LARWLVNAAGRDCFYRIDVRTLRDRVLREAARIDLGNSIGHVSRFIIASNLCAPSSVTIIAAFLLMLMRAGHLVMLFPILPSRFNLINPAELESN